MKNIFSVFFLVFCSFFSNAQSYQQTIRGTVTDLDSKITLPGATIVLIGDSTKHLGAVSDANGRFELLQIPTGRQTIKVSYIGYQEKVISLVLSSAKEANVVVELEESFKQLGTIEISASSREGVVNEMNLVSTRTFAVDETERYAGSRGDPARMASSFAGVQGANDARNDIVVRGNSPMGILWRLEGIDIPNPNHFAIAGTTGGPVSILNNKVLANSDFMTGAFPAEYGNSIAGVFDLKMRNGNASKHEYTGQFGFLGTELTLEGPLSKARSSSFLLNYRYSTLKMFEALKIKIGTSAVPNYQDGSFKFNFPTKKGALALFGIGGLSNINILVSSYTEPQEELYGEKNRDQYFGSSMGLVGASWHQQVGASTHSKLTLAHSSNESHSEHLLVYRNPAYQIDSLVPKLGFKGREYKTTLSHAISHKLNAQHSLKAGFFLDYYQFDGRDSLYNENTYLFEKRLNYSGGALFSRGYVQWKYRISNAVTANAGIYSQFFDLNKSKSLEPRAGLRWQITDRHAISGGIGMHSQMLPTYIYYQQLRANSTSDYVMHNRNVNFIRNNHYIITYDYSFAKNTRLKTEIYYQHLTDVPVEKKRSAYSLLNQGVGFTRIFPDSLINSGTGENYGIELTVEKFFSQSYFFLGTISIYESKYQGSDGVKRNTDFNGRLTGNILVGKDFKIAANNSLGFSSKLTYAGGRRYTPVDIAASEIKGEAVYIDALTNTLQLRDYFRTDLRITYKMNRKRVAHEIALDLVNLLNNKNVLSLTYSPGVKNSLREEYQLGFLPLFYYKIDF